MLLLTRQPIDVADLTRSVSQPEFGGLASFTGVVRNAHAGREVVRLEYTAYPTMAERVAEDIIRGGQARFGVRLAMRHRVGVLEVGEIAVLVVAAAAHRDEAFAACRWAIDELKRRVPIWKREHYADGTVAWVDPTAGGGVVTAQLAQVSDVTA
jgi:molybdopterin synthase catalytic subunit